ncbi:hypothetical protein EDB92DRAFT_1946461 [Lactarius akahatsu]|uniref:C2H2-type domain-containing protein n=1 Tax=Lactarius akahatsu TaxID=416441 RepID=A0AAD4LJ48_9AGAM|nr:hypothetical protein EDB92DRAFT_1946461 [Lactarius akahatsu]
MAATSGPPSANTELQTNIHSMPSRSTSHDETRRGDDRPTLPPIRDLFGRELSQPLHPNAPGIPVHYSPSSHFNQLALPDEPPYRGEQSRGNYTPSHVHARASGHTQLWPLTTPHHSSQRTHHAVYTSPAPAPHSFAPPQHESHDNTSRPAPAPSSSSRSRSGYGDNYNPEPTRGEDARWGIHPREHTHGMVQYSYPPPSPVPPQQSYAPSSSSRATSGGYQFARPMATPNSSSSSVIPSGLVTLEPSSARYACSYCGRGFTRPSSLRIHVHSHTGERPFKCTFDGCNRTFSVQSNMRRHARTHLQSGNEARESEGEDEGEEGSPQPPATQPDSAAPPR